MSTSTVRRLGLPTALSLLAVVTIGVAAAAPAFADATPQANASAQAENIDIPGVQTTASSSPPTSASNDGSGSSDPVKSAPGLHLSGSGLVYLSTTDAEIAQAGTVGDSYACAGVSVGALTVTNGGQDCTAAAGLGAPVIDLGAVPVVGSALSSAACTNLYFSWQHLLAHARNDGVDAPTGAASIGAVTISPCNRFGTGACPKANVAVGSGPDFDLLGAIIAALGTSSACAEYVTALQSVAGQVQFTLNHQTSPAPGVFRVDGMHFATLSGAPATFDFAGVTVGPNSIPTVDTPMFSTEALSLLGGAALLALLVALQVRSRLARKENR